MSAMPNDRAAGRVFQKSLRAGTGDGDFLGGWIVVEGGSRASEAEYARCKGPIGAVLVVGAGVGNGCCLVFKVGW